jgi:hypothetical protein
LRCEVIVRFVAIGGSVDHHCLNLLVTIFLNVGTLISYIVYIEKMHFII